ncbi:MAG: glycoside hydrolase family 88 protein [Chroococcidiopsidaceae cyanobacterium CP_BM_RX_35]|nr:glycoside hydrolase family 88 protein [Chroococcidiopsidaceae cyanobacterium CP_BM_RX_35]
MIAPQSCHLGVAAGMAALQIFYNLATGIWNTAEWWNAANALETTIDYSMLTNTLTYRGNIFNTFEKYKGSHFLNPWFYDDEGWWALTWIKAYDLTGEPRYLDMAKIIFNDMKRGWNSTCGGGLWWKRQKQQQQYKNAITNELFLSIAAKLHLRTPGDSGPGSYIDWAKREWNWFKQTGLINRSHLINDGLKEVAGATTGVTLSKLNSACQNNGQTTWTYNQGVILGGLVDLYKSTQDSLLLTQAQAIADAAIRKLAPNGILQEPCESNCGSEGAQFKGIFIRNLYYLYQITNKQLYKDFIIKNADSVWSDRNRDNQFGFSWAKTFNGADAARQSAALDTLNAAIFLGTTGITYQAENASLNQLSTAANNNGYHGTGYIVDWNHDGQSVTFNVNVACSGKYNLVFRYAAANGNASRSINVNDRMIVGNQIFPGTQSWDRWQSIMVPNIWLNAGNNTISVSFNSFEGSSNWLNLDEMTLQ